MKELKKVASMLGRILAKEEFDDFIAKADAVCTAGWWLLTFHKNLLQDGNGKLDYGEFVKMMLEY